MEIALIIAGGLVLLTGVAGFFDYLGKRKAMLHVDALRRIEALESEVAALKAIGASGEERIGRLESEMGFVNKLIEHPKE